jgi:hypothetical protein
MLRAPRRENVAQAKGVQHNELRNAGRGLRDTRVHALLKRDEGSANSVSR